MKLIIVESPTKAKTLSKFLGKEYTIEASMGHVRDLPKSTLGVDVEHDFQPSYIIPRDKVKHANALKKIAKKADEIILATDPDREGEAIAWHVAEIFKDTPLRFAKGGTTRGTAKKTKVAAKIMKNIVPSRIVFHEITESAIKDALLHPKLIDLPLVDAQQARRILDRLVGYKLSPLLWQKLSKRWLSAGRVQSVAVRLIVEREREIEKFKSVEYWTIDGVFNGHPREGGDPSGNSGFPIGSGMTEQINASLVSKDDKKYESTLSFDLFDGKYTTSVTSIRNEPQANDIIADFKQPFTVSAVDKKEIRRNPSAPYTTSTLQQDAGRKLYFSSKKTMQVAQKLYEEGFITYHRTDSVNIAEKFIEEARAYIGLTYGNAYLPSQPRRFKTKSRVAQEAHEAIRPTDVGMTNDKFQMANIELNRDHIRLYDLIWKRAVACQASEAVFDATTIDIISSNRYQFETNGSVIKFDGYLRVIGRDAEDTVIPNVAVGDLLHLEKSTPLVHTSNPPPRYTEASLVKTLEEKDIGRPSTYAPIISTIIDRQYVTREEKKLVPTELGCMVTDFLVKYFSSIIDLSFTARMEDDLDAVANGEKKWQPVIAEFYEPFSKILASTYDTAEKVTLSEEAIDEKCPNCTSPLVIRSGKFGKFVACTNFPTCTYTRQYGEKIDVKCPTCGNDMVVKKSKRGKQFYGCSTYPACTFAAWKKEDIK